MTIPTQDIPKIDTPENDVNELAEILGDRGQLLSMHDRRRVKTSNGASDDALFVSCLTLIDEPPSRVKDYVTDYENYENILEFFPSVSERADGSDQANVDYNLILETPIISPSFEYTLEYETLENGDVVFENTAGDFKHVMGRWEFIPIGSERTLLVYTTWTEFGSLGWTLKSVFWAEPDLKLAIPVTQAAVIVHVLKNHIQPDGDSPPKSIPEYPDIPLMSSDDLPLKSLASLARDGTLMYVHPSRWVDDAGEPLELRFVTGIGLIEKPMENAKEFTTNFGDYLHYIRQVSNVDVTTTDDGYEAIWTLDLGIGIVSMSLHYTLKYEWQGDHALTFHRTTGDLQHVYGALEWEPLERDETLFFYSTATQLGQEDSLLVKLASMMPHRQLVTGITAGALAVQNIVENANNSL